jgi:Cyanobacterial TRADD-N associated 2-Transmembrane domain
VSDDIPDGGKDDELEKVLAEADYHFLKPNRIVATGGPIPDGLYNSIGVPVTGSIIWEGDYARRQQAVEEVAKANPNNIQEVAASQLSIINSYYQSGLQQSQQSFKWSLIWGGIGLGFLIAAVSFLLIHQPTEVAIASGIAGIIEEMVAGFFLYLYKHASDQLAAFRASLESTQRLLLANSMCEKLEGEVEQITRAELIRLMVNSAVQLTPGTLVKKEA